MNEHVESQMDPAGWSAIARTWQLIDDTPRLDIARLRASVDRETKAMRRWRALEVAFSSVVVAVPLWYAARHPGARALTVLADSWTVLIIVWAFAHWGRRGLWAPSAESSAAYVRVAHRRSDFRARTALLAMVLVAAQLAVAGLIAPPLSWLQAAAAAAWLVWAVWMRRRALRERQYLRSLLSQLSE